MKIKLLKKLRKEAKKQYWIEIDEGKGSVMCKYQNYHTYKRCIIPTAEQMISWLEEKGITSIEITFSKETKWKFEMFSEIYDFGAPYYSRKEATLAAIDAALEYLSKK